jgi:hypothetical protein
MFDIMPTKKAKQLSQWEPKPNNIGLLTPTIIVYDLKVTSAMHEVESVLVCTLE